MNLKDIKKNNFFLSKKKYKNIYLIGIGGSGMLGIALILLKLGYKISGSDLSNSLNTTTLINLGATIYFQHSEKNIQNIDFVIKSSAISSKNKEIIAAKKRNIPILLRAEMLEIFMNFKFGIAISGTHGKTTTTSMISDIFIESGINPTLINGGLIKSINSHAQLGSSHYFIAEADESDSSFLYLNPKIVILTNIEPDHMDHYNNSFTKLKQTFLCFLKKIPLHGTAIVCIDDSAIYDVLTDIKCKVITYGFNKNADVRITFYKQNNFFGNFTIILKNKKKLSITLNIPGKHNALNAAAAIALAINEGISNHDIIVSLKNFQGTCRRFEFLGFLSIEKNISTNTNCMLIDDYGHHPTELSETIKTIRMSWPNKKLIMIFQPHRYTRTYNLYNDFVCILSKVDVLLILNVYSSNEKFILGADSCSLFNDIKKIGKNHAILISDNNLILDALIPQLSGNDIILIQGAGNVDTIVRTILIKKKSDKMNKKIAVLLGGTSSEREISIKSGYAVLNSLLKSGLNAYPIDTRDYSIMQLGLEGFDKVYISLHGHGGEDGSIQGVLQHLKIPYTGSGIMSSAISIDKFRTKLLWKSRGLVTAPDIYISKKKNIASLYPLIVKKTLKLGFPVLIKPNNQGSSIGITLVSCLEQLQNAIKIAFSYDNNILIEKFIKGKEYTVSVLGDKVLPSIHISTKNNFYDYDAKYTSCSTKYSCPSGLNILQEKELQKIALLAWNTLGCSGCGRIDVILDNENKFWLLEVNTIPGMTNRSLVPMSAKNMGISFDELVLLILNMNDQNLL